MKRSITISKNKYDILVEEEGSNNNKNNIKELLKRSIKNEIHVIIDIFYTCFFYL